MAAEIPRSTQMIIQRIQCTEQFSYCSIICFLTLRKSTPKYVTRNNVLIVKKEEEKELPIFCKDFCSTGKRHC